MTTTRQDAWTQDEDLLLAEVVLRHIREAGTQLAAFEEVGRKLSRTAAACGFRWNSFVRKQYKTGIELAKKQRKELRKHQGEAGDEFDKTNMALPSSEKESQALTLQEVIQFLKHYDHTTSLKDLQNENHTLLQKLGEMERKIDSLQHEKQSLMNQLRVVEEDYKALIEIMERARKMVVLQDDERNKKVKFQMDRNGNLERIEK
ncbi:sporulation-specific transcriptional regulator GerR [Metabacillus arenae]|uniref:Sporulation-specific transcriptional regulator GerR n=1 Tax=Metabacillus arenae TaxID=2771434 RepID=A0A926NF26_9BACI|nr:sporulation-specific transcriptional regulator GerR [Metabacillus arenae]MBD1379915.1 sporulation-specific transcriptional regulator GerR [Metabacillus arenae]